MNRTKLNRPHRRQLGALALRLTPQAETYDEVEMLRTGWRMINQYRLQRLIITVEPAERTERIRTDA